MARSAGGHVFGRGLRAAARAPRLFTSSRFRDAIRKGTAACAGEMLRDVVERGGRDVVERVFGEEERVARSEES